MQSQQMLLSRADSPPDNGANSLRHHIQSQEPLYSLHGSQSTLYANQSNGIHIPSDFTTDIESQKAAKMNNIYRSSFTSFPNATRPRHPPNQFRDTANGFYNAQNTDVFPSQLTSPTLQHIPAFDHRASFDLNSVQKSSGFMDSYSKSQTSQSGYGNQSGTYTNGMQLSSQTPFGPHLPANAGVAPGSLSQPNGNIINPNQNTQQEDICTIFVVGFPDDMQEREFQNMFTFSSGFEAATLKIPNKEYTAYGSVANGTTAPSGRSYGYSGSNDPYNLVTVNQGGVVVDGRDGTMASWPAADDGVAGPHYGAGTVPPRKQIIGFAKFRTKDEALAAKEMLQGKRVDIEKGAVLKAEMAKKNLHTKRGVGPVPSSATIPNTAGVGQNVGGLGNGLNVLPHSMMNGINHPDSYSLGGDVRERDIGTLSSMGLGRMHWRDEAVLAREREEDWRERQQQQQQQQQQRDMLTAMGLATRGPRERAEEEERDRRKREKDMLRRPGPFEPFHPIATSSISRQPSGAPLVSPPGSNTLLSPLDNPNNIVNGFNGHVSQVTQNMQPDERTITKPWDGTNRTIRPPSRRTPSPPSSGADTQRPYSPSHPPPQLQSESRSSSSAGGSHRGGSHGSASDEEMSQAIGGLALSTSQGNTSPQLPSPASGASSGGSTRNGVDQNPPINTLYVGNLPTSPPPPGIPPDLLENSLRELFSARPGYRRLSFKQKNSGPMCFVEFDDVHYATKTLNDLYGHTLNGLVKGGGIRLSYSKNPLGVRTPTSANSNGPSLQQQQTNGHYTMQDDRPIIRRGVLPPPSSAHYPPPPRFSTTSNSSAFEAPSAPLTGMSDYLPRNNMYGYNLTPSMTSFSPFGISNSSHSTIPDQSESDQPHNDQHYHYIPRALSPPAHNIEAARAG